MWQSWVQERFPAPEDMDSGARMVDLSVEVPVSPGQAWQAIATGPGIEAWFTPTELEEWEGGAIVTDHGPYGKSTGVVTAWDPPRRFAYEERDWDPGAPDAPPWATEILVQAAAGGTSIVRLVSGFARGGASWEDEIAGTREGWGSGLRNLRLYLTHFAGLAAAAGMVAASVDADGPAALARACRRTAAAGWPGRGPRRADGHRARSGRPPGPWPRCGPRTGQRGWPCICTPTAGTRLPSATACGPAGRSGSARSWARRVAQSS